MTQKQAVHIKDPEAVLDYPWDWSEWLAGVDDTEEIVSHTMLIDDAALPVTPPAGALVVDTSAISSGTGSLDVYVVPIVSGGTIGTDYRLTCRIVTTSGLTEDRTRIIKVRAR